MDGNIIDLIFRLFVCTSIWIFIKDQKTIEKEIKKIKEEIKCNQQQDVY